MVIWFQEVLTRVSPATHSFNNTTEPSHLHSFTCSLSLSPCTPSRLLTPSSPSHSHTFTVCLVLTWLHTFTITHATPSHLHAITFSLISTCHIFLRSIISLPLTFSLSDLVLFSSINHIHFDILSVLSYRTKKRTLIYIFLHT